MKTASNLARWSCVAFGFLLKRTTLTNTWITSGNGLETFHSWVILGGGHNLSESGFSLVGVVEGS